jgi:phosphatidylglycerol---prolipoprotein diacylglyceryl transferase
MLQSYSAFYVLGIGAAISGAWYLGRRAGLDPARWALALAVTMVAGIIGSRMLHFDLVIDGFGDRTILGGLIGGALAFLAIRRSLGLNARSADVLAVALPLGHGLGRIGCHLIGCCFGRPTHMPWAASYGPGTEAYDAHLAAGLVPEGAFPAILVHPVPLYEAAVQLVLAILAWRFANRFRRPGSVLLAVVGVYGAARFLLEGFRLEAWLQPGISSLQWLVALLAGVSLFWLWWRERGVKPIASDRLAEAALGALAAVPPLFFLVRGEAFTPIELVVVAAALAMATPWTLTRIRRLTATMAMAGAMPAVAGIILIQAVGHGSGERSGYTTLGASGSAGSYVESCGGARQVSAAGASITRTSPSGVESWVVTRAHGFVGSDEEVSMAGGGLSVAGEGPWLGAGIGFIAGSLTVDGTREPIFPTAHLRLGRLDRVFLEGRLAEHEPVGAPIPLVSVGIGFGLGRGENRVGLGVGGSGFYGTGRLVSQGWELEPFLAFGDAETYQGGIAIRKRLGVGAQAASLPAPIER